MGKTNGKIIEVVPSVQLKNKLCGLCGNFQKPIMSETVTGQCVFSKPELEIASWVIPTGSSSVMTPSILSELKKESEMCPKMTGVPLQGPSHPVRTLLQAPKVPADREGRALHLSEGGSSGREAHRQGHHWSGIARACHQGHLLRCQGAHAISLCPRPGLQGNLTPQHNKGNITIQTLKQACITGMNLTMKKKYHFTRIQN